MSNFLKAGLVVGGLILFGAGCTKQALLLQSLGTVQPQPADNLPQDEEARLPTPDIREDEVPQSEIDKLMTKLQSTPISFEFSSSAFAPGAMIPQKYSCDGQDINPPLSWGGAPEGTKSFALIIDDPDAVQVVGKVVDHWVLWNIPAATTSIAEGTVPAGASQGMSYDAPKYQGPCPPSGTTHRYVFKLYALDVARLELPPSTSGKVLEAAMQGHILKKVEFTGRYTAQ